MPVNLKNEFKGNFWRKHETLQEAEQSDAGTII